MDKNTQQPVAWIDDDGMVFWKDGIPPDGTDLFISPTVPRDVLMAALGDCRAECAKHYLGDADESEINLAAIADRYASKVQDDQPTVQDYEDVLADHRKLVRELDVLLNGEDGAAKQAKLCDIVAQVSRMKAQPEPVNQQMLAALEPFALISKEGVVTQIAVHVTVTTCAEYFHRSAHALAAAEAARPATDPWQPSDADYDRSVHHCPDAKAWADLFVQTYPGLASKHDLMLGWFANAMMAMHDHMKEKQPASAQPVAVPEGFVLVPIDPTSQMCRAGTRAWSQDQQWLTAPVSIYSAMLSAAPKLEGV